LREIPFKNDDLSKFFKTIDYSAKKEKKMKSENTWKNVLKMHKKEPPAWT